MFAMPLTGGMDPYAKDLIETISWIAAICVGAVTAWRVLQESRHNREQRERALEAAREDHEQRDRELRWRRAEFGNKAVKEMLDDPEAWIALQVLDWSNRTYTIGGQQFQIRDADLPAALEAIRRDFLPKEMAIRDIFDSLFFHFGRLQHALNVDLVTKNDIEVPVTYYIGRMASRRQVFEPFLREFHPAALAFVQRFAEWS